MSEPQQGEGSKARCEGVRAWGSEKGVRGVGKSTPTQAFGCEVLEHGVAAEGVQMEEWSGIWCESLSRVRRTGASPARGAGN